MSKRKSNKKQSKKRIIIIVAALFVLGLFASNGNEDRQNNSVTSETTNVVETGVVGTEKSTEDILSAVQAISNDKTINQESTTPSNSESIDYNGATYKIIQVDGGDLSGSRQSNVAVDIGYGDRTYWAFTNEHGQLVYVTADKITLQDDSTEPVNSDGRYYPDEAKVPGTEREDLDEGHVIADSLGGVSNAYNITPQNSTLNRHGDQAYMEKVIRDAGGCENFVATITYPDTTTQIPSHYHYEYVLNGSKVVDDFDNVNPDEVNAAISTQVDTAEATTVPTTEAATTNEKEELSRIDANGNGKVTIAEAKAAGYSMPIYSDHWLYKYMDDRDHDGMVGE